MLWNIVQLFMLRGITTKRWNNFPRVEEFSVLDNVGIRMHIAMLLTAIEKNNGNKVNEELILKKILFSTFPIVILSDISRELKEYLDEKNNTIFKQVQQKAIDFLFSFNFHASIKNDMESTIRQEPTDVEAEIREEARLYSAYIEAKHNAMIFPMDYEHQIIWLQNAIQKKREESPRFDTLLSEANHEKYLLSVRKLVHTKRWNRMKRFYPISVMEHLAIVGFISYILTLLEKERGETYDLNHILKRALFHDIAESITGDVITPTKRILPEFRWMLLEAEEAMLADRFSPIIPEVARDDVMFYMTDEDSKESKLVKHADNLCMVLETLIEVNVWNTPFRAVHASFKKRLADLWHPSIDFFLKYVPDCFSDDLDAVFTLK